MSMQDRYVIALGILFAVVFAIMVFATIKHRKACVRTAAKVAGTRGPLQWFWMLVPLAILGVVNFSLISVQPAPPPSVTHTQQAQR